MRALLKDADIEVFRKIMDINFFGTVYCTKLALDSLIERKGTIVGISSIAGYRGLPGRSGYSASKFALVALTRALMIELHDTGVRCALICPGNAPTGFQQRADAAKYPRITRLVDCTSEQVAEATVRAIQRRTATERRSTPSPPRSGAAHASGRS